MNKKELARFRKILARKKEEVAGQIARLESNYSNGPSRDSSGYGIHMAETGSDEEQLEKNLTFLSQEGDILKLIDDALERIDHMQYGICEGCGASIPKNGSLPNLLHDTASHADAEWSLPGKPNKSRRSLIVLVAVILAVLGLDLATKEWARSVLSGSPIPILPGFFTLAYVENTGIAFGLFQTQGRLLTFLSPLALLVLAGALGRYVYQAGRYSAACVCGLIIGGAAGNVWSRLTDGYVVDFLDFYIGTCHWPTFNAADTALCCGVAGFLWLSHLADRSGRIPLKNQESSHDNASR